MTSDRTKSLYANNIKAVGIGAGRWSSHVHSGSLRIVSACFSLASARLSKIMYQLSIFKAAVKFRVQKGTDLKQPAS